MGTTAASSGPGAGTPLVPSWLDGADAPAAPAAPIPAGGPPPAIPPAAVPVPPGQPQPVPPEALPSIQSPAEPKRFQSARLNFTHYISGGNRSTLNRALRDYVTKSSGGPRKASQRMAVPRRVASRILSFRQAVQAGGTAEALRTFGLAKLVGRPVEEITPQLVDAWCEGVDGGGGDEGIARNALTEAMAEVCAEGMLTGADFSLADLRELFIRFVTHSITDRVFNDIGMSAISLPTDVAAVQRLEREVLDVIRGSVRDAIGSQLDQAGTMSREQLNLQTDRIYQLAYELVALAGES